jgi:hypothetical protein
MTDCPQTGSPASAARPASDKRRLALDGDLYTLEEFSTCAGSPPFESQERGFQHGHLNNGLAILRKSECLDSAEPPVAITATDPQDTAVSSSQQGFVHAGKHYAGAAASHPVFVPPDDFFIQQPQLWIRCACPHHCYVCVYDGTSLCRGCDPVWTAQCECEPGCCDVPPSGESDSCDEGTTVSMTPTGIPEIDRNETVWQSNSVRVTEPAEEQSRDSARLRFH